ncbi:sphingosine-1-phosphate lyase [Lingula anatina]|uniref:Sphingosine-1-phosphate lyase n=1 Tax=Lingula anatina TaxID=7574 RepID=A0A1S3JY76_LINAN|nr:sphingosine-1-phosphate lyase [Lingula anatina]|eukprot:XP_013415262.1 sphingosine-1-phosphate lyase [Lingula anatina]
MISITSFLLWAEHVVFTLVILWAVQTAFLHGLGGLVGQLLRFLKLTVPGVDSLIKSTLQNEVQGFINQVKSDPSRTSGQTQAAAKRIVVIPRTGIPPAELLKEMNAMKEREVAVMEEGKIFAYVYTQENDKLEQVQLEAFNLYTEQPQLSTHHDKLVLEAHHAFLHENALSPMVFPSLRKFETEVISMSANMLHGDGHVVGSLTSGGTESILMAVKTYRDRARKLFPHIKVPNMVAPVTIHPAFVKAAHYFGLELVTVAVDQRSQRPDMAEYEQAITAQTIVLLASAPQYCHGVVDPIPEISEIAVRRGLPLHVDACVGGYMLPWVEKLGYQVPEFDFRLPGVTSMSADLHKYGYTFKVVFSNAGALR